MESEKKKVVIPLNEKKVLWQPKCFVDDHVPINEGFLIEYREEDGLEDVFVRDDVDDYRPDDFYKTFTFCLREMPDEKTMDELYFLQGLMKDIHDRINDIWNELPDVDVTKERKKEESKNEN